MKENELLTIDDLESLDCLRTFTPYMPLGIEKLYLLDFPRCEVISNHQK